MTSRGGNIAGDHVYFEMQQAGSTLKVTALDPGSLLEATVFGPMSAGEHALKVLAIRKLRYLLARARARAGTH